MHLTLNYFIFKKVKYPLISRCCVSSKCVSVHRSHIISPGRKLRARILTRDVTTFLGRVPHLNNDGLAAWRRKREPLKEIRGLWLPRVNEDTNDEMMNEWSYFDLLRRWLITDEVSVTRAVLHALFKAFNDAPYTKEMKNYVNSYISIFTDLISE